MSDKKGSANSARVAVMGRGERKRKKEKPIGIGLVSIHTDRCSYIRRTYETRAKTTPKSGLETIKTASQIPSFPSGDRAVFPRLD